MYKAAPNWIDKKAEVRSIPEPKARIALGLGNPLFFGDREIQ
jgi:hypothetical protein